jgi:glycosyltransferase 2 family protein
MRVVSSTLLSGRLASLATTRTVRLAVAAVLLGIVFSLVDARAVWSRLSAFNPAIALLMLAVNGLALSLFAARWRAIASALGIHAPYLRFLRGTWLAAFASQLGPALILNEITRFHVLRSSAPAWPLAASQFVDRLSGQIVLLAVIVLLIPCYFILLAGEIGARIALAAAGMIVLCVALLALAHKLRRCTRVPSGSLRQIFNPLASPAHYGCSLAIQLLLMANLWLAVAGLGHGTPPLELYLMAPLVLGSLTLLPVSAGDWGSREAAALLFLSATGLTAETIVAASVAYGGINLLSALPAVLLAAHAGVEQPSAIRAPRKH